jgi:hypothetical protein
MRSSPTGVNSDRFLNSGPLGSRAAAAYGVVVVHVLASSRASFHAIRFATGKAHTHKTKRKRRNVIRFRYSRCGQAAGSGGQVDEIIKDTLVGNAGKTEI